MTGHAFQHLMEENEVFSVLTAIHGLLRADGEFIFETRNPEAEGWLEWTPAASHTTIANVEHGRVEVWHDWQSAENRRVVFHTHYKFLNRDVTKISRTELRFWAYEELLQLFKKTGFEVTSVFGD